jgi:1,4-dihydroxy-2-naphthoate polyprenyltransferase
MKLKLWLLETRPQFLILSVVLAFLGASMGYYDGAFHLGYALLAFLGLLLAHASVNILNDYFDYRSGIDLATQRTPFSGGSGMLPGAILKPKAVLWFGIICLLAATPIGIYFVIVRGWLLLPLLVVGALCTVLYTPLLTRWGWPEWAPGVGLGVLPILGAYFVQTGDYTFPAVIASIPSGILVHNLLFINEFPDVEADRKAGRKTLPIVMGKKGAGVVYSVLTVLVYVWIVVWVGLGVMPVWSLLGLLTIPFAVKAIRGALRPDSLERIVSAMSSNVQVVLLTQLLLGIGYVLAGLGVF